MGGVSVLPSDPGVIWAVGWFEGFRTRSGFLNIVYQRNGGGLPPKSTGHSPGLADTVQPYGQSSSACTRNSNVTENPDQHGRASTALSSHVHALIFIAVQAVTFLRVFPDKGHNKFVVARRVVDSPGLDVQGFLLLLLRAALE